MGVRQDEIFQQHLVILESAYGYGEKEKKKAKERERERERETMNREEWTRQWMQNDPKVSGCSRKYTH